MIIQNHTILGLELSGNGGGPEGDGAVWTDGARISARFGGGGGGFFLAMLSTPAFDVEGVDAEGGGAGRSLG